MGVKDGNTGRDWSYTDEGYEIPVDAKWGDRTRINFSSAPDRVSKIVHKDGRELRIPHEKGKTLCFEIVDGQIDRYALLPRTQCNAWLNEKLEFDDLEVVEIAE